MRTVLCGSCMLTKDHMAMYWPSIDDITSGQDMQYKVNRQDKGLFWLYCNKTWRHFIQNSSQAFILILNYLVSQWPGISKVISGVRTDMNAPPSRTSHAKTCSLVPRGKLLPPPIWWDNYTITDSYPKQGVLLYKNEKSNPIRGPCWIFALW